MKDFKIEKLILSLTVICTVLVTSLVPSTTVFGATGERNGVESGPVVTLSIPEDEYFEELNADVLNEVKEQIKADLNLGDEYEVSLPSKCYTYDSNKASTNSSDATSYIDIDSTDIKIVNNNGGITPKGGGSPVKYDYRVVYHHNKAVIKNNNWRYATGLPGGYKGAKYLTYSPTGGSTYTLGVSLPAPWLPVSISVSSGRQAASGLSMQVETTSTKKYNRVMAIKDYKVTPYSSQRKKKSGGSWQTYSRGSKSKLYRVNAKCVTV